jgi:Na+-transporting methylmalonyl-CoA/oxaloacetate decarboxylase gamma subunit
LNPLLQGLQVSLLAMFITFLALGIFILVMILLQRFFPSPVSDDALRPGSGEEAVDEVSTTIEDASEESAIAAAIAVAMDYFQKSGKDQLGTSLQEGKGSWWVSQRPGKEER